MVRKHASTLLFPKILNTTIHYQEGTLDEAVWTLNDSGLFTCSSAWEIIRKKKTKTMTSTYIWYKHIPFKSSSLLWRALRGKLPTNDNLATFGVEPVLALIVSDLVRIP